MSTPQEYHGHHRRRRLAAAALLATGLLPGLGRPAAADPGEVARRVLDGLQTARRNAGLDELRYRTDLESIARDRAERMAAMPHDRRLASPVEGQLRETGIKSFRRAAVHVDLNRGYPDPAAAFVKSWRRYEPSWANAVSPEFDSVGLASQRAADGWVVLVVILLEEETVPSSPDLRAMEGATMQAINEVRRDHGLQALSPNPLLAEIARGHSEDMIRRGYFDHRSPDGTEPADRVLRRGLRFSRVGENVHRSRGVDDPVESAVRGWLKSKGHRRVLLAVPFRETGVGVAADDEGAIYMTQLFLAPPPGP